MPSYKYLTYELLDEGTIARITLNRPGSRNAQNRGLLVELNDAMLAAEADDQVRVVILGGAGPMFSAGHDLGSREHRDEREPGPGQHPTYRQYGGSRLGAEQRTLQEWHFFFNNTRRWRDLRTVELKLLAGRRVAGLVRFRNDGSKTGRLRLGAGSGKPGAQRVLRSGALSLLLAQCRVKGSGPTGKTVTINLALSVGRKLAGHALTLKLGATSRQGTRQPFRRAGSLTIRRSR